MVKQEKMDKKTAANSDVAVDLPNLAKLLEEDKPNLQPMKDRVEQIKDFIKTQKNQASRMAASQALKAYELFFELFDHLLKIKENLKKQEAQQKNK